jgi:hypothetical protein
VKKGQQHPPYVRTCRLCGRAVQRMAVGSSFVLLDLDGAPHRLSCPERPREARRKAEERQGKLDFAARAAET